MSASPHRRQASPTTRELVIGPSRLHHFTERAIAASNNLTFASIASDAMSEAEYAGIDHAASMARRELLDCLEHDYGIDKTMADQLGALL